MASCEAFNDRLLDYAYGLLDEPEAQALRGHLESCGRCQEALRGVQARQALFARAALPIGRDAVPAFNAPAEAPPAEAPPAEGPPAEAPLAADAATRVGVAAVAAPATIALVPAANTTASQRRLRRRYWFSGAAAAAVLLLAGALTYAYHGGLAERQDVVDEHRAIIREIDAQLRLLEPEYKAKAADVERKIRNEAPPHVYTIAPAQVAPDGATVVQMAVNDVAGKPVNAKITASLTDAEGKQILDRKEVIAEGGRASVTLGDARGDAIRGQKTVHFVAEVEAGTARAQLQETLQVARPVYAAHLMTNQSVYRQGDLLLFRALVLDRASLTPAHNIALQFSLFNAKGTLMAQRQAVTGAGGIAASVMAIDDLWADGAYELRVTAQAPAAVDVRPHSRKLQVARNGAQLAQTDRTWYRAGDTVTASVPRPQGVQNNAAAPLTPDLDVFVNGHRIPAVQWGQGGGRGGMAQGGGGGFGGAMLPGQAAPPPGPLPPNAPAPPRAVAPNALAGGPAAQGFNNGPQEFGTNSANQMYLQFALPRDIDTSRARLRIVLKEGTEHKTFEQELAIIPSRLSVDFFPEGGDLIAGVPNRVYYRVRTPRGEPVNPEGRVILLSSTDVLLDSAPGAGTGSFTFTPQVGETYTVRISRPGDAPIEHAAPFARVGGVRKDGLVLHAPQPVAAEGEPVEVVLRNPGGPRRVLLVAQCRGRFVGQQWVEAGGAATRVAMGTLPGARGLVRLTVYDASAGTLKPLAERLIYRAPAGRLNLAVLDLGGVIAPKYGQKGVQLELRSSDELGEAKDAWIGIGIAADDRVQGREPNPLAHFFIAGDVRKGEDLDDAALLAADNPAARQALDLFLGTVGWRRFEAAAGDGGAPADAAFIGCENASPRVLQSQLQTRLDEAIRPLDAAMQQAHAQQAAHRETAQLALETAQTDLNAFEARPWEWLRIGLGLSIIVLLGIACLALIVGTWRVVRHRAATPWLACSFACMSICLIGTIMLASLMQTAEHGRPQLTAGRGPAPGHLDPGQVRDVPAGLPAGRLAFARAAEPLAPLERQALPDGAKGDHLKEAQLDRLATARDSRSMGRLAQGPAAAKNADAFRALRQRFDEALKTQRVARADKNPAAPPMTSMAEKKSFSAAAKAQGGAKPKDIAPVSEQNRLATESTRRYFAPNFVAGRDFDTLLWHPGLFVSGGSAQIAFDVPPTPGTYRVLLFANSADGRLGFYEGRLEIQPDLGR